MKILLSIAITLATVNFAHASIFCALGDFTPSEFTQKLLMPYKTAHFDTLDGGNLQISVTDIYFNNFSSSVVTPTTKATDEAQTLDSVKLGTYINMKTKAVSYIEKDESNRILLKHLGETYTCEVLN